MSSIKISLTFSNLFKILFLIFVIVIIVFLFKFLSSVSSSFQKYLVIFTFIILIICLIIIGATIQRKKNSGEWPPEYPECPDYFKVVKSTATGAICKNIQRLGNNNCHGNVDFTGSTFSGKYGMCNKYKWANNCNISWDGITYGKDNPCLNLD